MTAKSILKINGEKVPLNDYMQLLLKKINMALISTLKGVDIENLQHIEVELSLSED